MKVRFYVSAMKNREKDLAKNFGLGVVDNGDRFKVSTTRHFQEPDESTDVACVFALKGSSRVILDSYRAIGKRTLLFDKGLMRASTGLGGPNGFYRIGLDEFMPISRIRRQMLEATPADRWWALRMDIRPRVEIKLDSSVIYCGSSQKYCDFHDLGNEHDYAISIIDKIRKFTDRPIIYRPKPSFLEAKEIEGTCFSRTPEMLGTMLPSAHALVTHGSHAGIDSIMGGVPVITLGPCAAYPLAEHSISCLSKDILFYPRQELIVNWLSAITYWQWSISEMASGKMWRWLRDEMEKPA